MWNVFERTWESDSMCGSSRNFGVKYLKSIPFVSIPMVAALILEQVDKPLTSFLVVTVAVPCPCGQAPWVLSNHAVGVPCLDSFEGLLGKVGANIDNPTHRARKFFPRNKARAHNCKGGRAAENVLHVGSNPTEFDIICSRGGMM